MVIFHSYVSLPEGNRWIYLVIQLGLKMGNPKKVSGSFGTCFRCGFDHSASYYTWIVNICTVLLINSFPTKTNQLRFALIDKDGEKNEHHFWWESPSMFIQCSKTSDMLDSMIWLERQVRGSEDCGFGASHRRQRCCGGGLWRNRWGPNNLSEQGIEPTKFESNSPTYIWVCLKMLCTPKPTG